MFLLNPKLWDTILTVVTTAFSTAMAPWQGTFFAADLAGVSQMAMDGDEKKLPKSVQFFFSFLLMRMILKGLKKNNQVV